ncbi:MAG: TSUP family transporter [Bacteriovoracaceae bacterium]
MLAAGVPMINGRKNTEEQKKKINPYYVTLEGLIVGAVTGFVGAGGGFLIVPALVTLAGLLSKKIPSAKLNQPLVGLL